MYIKKDILITENNGFQNKTANVDADIWIHHNSREEKFGAEIMRQKTLHWFLHTSIM